MLTVSRHGKAERAPTSKFYGGRENGTAQETISKGITNQMGLRVRKKTEITEWQKNGRESNSKTRQGYDLQ